VLHCNYVYLAPLTRYYYLFSKILKRSRYTSHIFFWGEGIYHARSVSTQNLKCVGSFTICKWLRVVFVIQLGHDIFHLSTKFDNSSFSNSIYIIGAKKFKMGHVTKTTFLLKVMCVCQILGLDTAYPCTKFEHSNFSRSRDMVGAHQNVNGSRDQTARLSGTVCHLWASTCYRQPTYQIWSLYLHSLQIHERRYKMSKMQWFGGVPWLSYGVVYVILGLAIFVKLRLVTDTQTDRRTHVTAYTALA